VEMIHFPSGSVTIYLDYKVGFNGDILY